MHTWVYSNDVVSLIRPFSQESTSHRIISRISGVKYYSSRISKIFYQLQHCSFRNIFIMKAFFPHIFYARKINR